MGFLELWFFIFKPIKNGAETRSELEVDKGINGISLLKGSQPGCCGNLRCPEKKGSVNFKTYSNCRLYLGVSPKFSKTEKGCRA